MPVVLIHGIGASASTRFNWENFLAFAKAQDDFNARYKLYLYHYDSSRSVPDISANLQQTLRLFLANLGKRPIKIVAYSEGGLLTRNALQDDDVNTYVQEVITIATPFHGSPLANPDWVRQQLKTESPFSLVRIGQRLAYKITGKLYPTFKEDFHWDNFDDALPATSEVGNVVHTSIPDYKLAKKVHFVTYGSYFGLELDQTAIPQVLGTSTTVPKEKPIIGNLFRRNLLFSLVRHNISKLPLASKKILPTVATGAKSVPTKPGKSSLVSVASIEEEKHTLASSIKAASNESTDDIRLSSGENPVLANEAEISLSPAVHGEVTLTGLQKTQAELNQVEHSAVSANQPLTISSEHKQNGTIPLSMMMFNDGISPISSSLWLGRYLPPKQAGASVSVEKLWDTLKKLKGKGNTRLFAGVDHRNWMDGTTRTSQDEIQDLLNPEEAPKTIFAWIVYDLMS